jgi:hypothetical protein
MKEDFDHLIATNLWNALCHVLFSDNVRYMVTNMDATGWTFSSLSSTITQKDPSDLSGAFSQFTAARRAKHGAKEILLKRESIHRWCTELSFRGNIFLPIWKRNPIL